MIWGMLAAGVALGVTLTGAAITAGIVYCIARIVREI
jgi:hypothetical protein